MSSAFLPNVVRREGASVRVQRESPTMEGLRGSRSGFGEAVPSGGLAIDARSPDGTDTLSTLACQRLRDDILSGSLAPGEKLRLQELRTRYGIGIAPLREALVRLHGDQLVNFEGHRGYWVAPISVHELRDLTRVRVLLEAEALRGSVERGGDDWEGSVLSAFHRLARATERGAHLNEGTLPEWEARHEEFHQALIAGDGSRLLLRLRSRLAQLVGRYRRLALTSAGSRPHLDEHKGIMDAALTRDADRAVQLLSEHYELTTQAILAKFKGTEE